MTKKTQLVLKEQEPVETAEVFLEENGCGGIFLSIKFLNRPKQPIIHMALVDPQEQGVKLLVFTHPPEYRITVEDL